MPPGRAAHTPGGVYLLLLISCLRVANHFRARSVSFPSENMPPPQGRCGLRRIALLLDNPVNESAAIERRSYPRSDAPLMGIIETVRERSRP